MTTKFTPGPWLIDGGGRIFCDSSRMVADLGAADHYRRVLVIHEHLRLVVEQAPDEMFKEEK